MTQLQLTASGTVPGNRCVKVSGSNSVTVTTSSTDNVVGVSNYSEKSNGEVVTLQENENNLFVLTAGGTIAAGDLLSPTTNGQVITTTSGSGQFVALSSATLGSTFAAQRVGSIENVSGTTFTTLTVTNDATISGLRIGKGNNGVAQNTAVGSDALGVVGDANRNTAVGYQAGYSINGGCDNTLVGRNAGRLITGGAGNASGFDNTCIGSNAGQTISTGNTNTLIGSAAGRDLTSSSNTVVGWAAALVTTTGGSNTAVGANALRNNGTGNGNVAVGNDALRGLAGAMNVGASTAVGASALQAVQPTSTSRSNTAVGFQAGLAITTGAFNVAVGNQALVQNQLGDNNTALGEYSGDGCKASNNTVAGTNSAYRNWWGVENVMLGRGAGWGNATIDNQTNEFFPTNPPYNASQNTVVGFEAFKFPKDTSGQASFSVTIAAGSPIVVTWATSTPANGTKVAFTTTGTLPGALSAGVTYYVVGQSGTTFNLALTPSGAAINNATSGSGTHTGYLSGTTVADGNTIVGYQAGSNNPMSGKYNCLFGWKAGDALTTGDNNIVIGKDQDADSASGSNQINVGGVYFHDRLLYTERSDPAAPAANQAVVYARDNGSGKTQLCVRFNTGAIQVLATQP